MDCKNITVLGVDYVVRFGTSEEYPLLSKMDGYTDESIKLIIVDDMTAVAEEADAKKNVIAYRNSVVRHEIIHAFLCESGLGNNTSECNSWATNEEMVDWFAKQFPKILLAFEQADCI